MPRGQDADGVPLHFTAKRICWLALTVDGHRLAYRMLQEGETVTAHMQQRVAVRTGDAGALLVSVGQGGAKPLGAPGAVRTSSSRRATTGGCSDSSCQACHAGTEVPAPQHSRRD